MALDAFGHSMTTRSAYDATRKGGTCVVIGIAPEGVEAEIPMVDIVRNQKTVVRQLLRFSVSARDLQKVDRVLPVWETRYRRPGSPNLFP